MKRLVFSLVALASLALVSAAEAATCFWVGGSGTWSTTNTASWASSSGGTGGTCAATGGVPKQNVDNATVDASLGGGTLTVDSTMNGVTISVFTMGAANGTVDFSANNPSMTFGAGSGFSVSGTGTRTLNCGTGTFTFTGAGTNVDFTTRTNLTTNCTGATFLFTNTSSARSVSLGMGGIYGTFVFNSDVAGLTTITQAGPTTLTGLTINGPGNFGLSGQTLTVSNPPTISGADSAHAVYLTPTATSGVAPISVASGTVTLNWVALSRVTFSGGATFTAGNSFDLGGNTGITIAGPTGGAGGGKIIGGFMLGRDLNPASNDNTLVWLEKAA